MQIGVSNFLRTLTILCIESSTGGHAQLNFHSIVLSKTTNCVGSLEILTGGR
jgi:hypothetical protein